MTEGNSIEFLYADAANYEVASRSNGEQSVAHLYKQMETCGLRPSKEAFELYNRTLLASARSQSSARSLAPNLGLIFSDLSGQDPTKFEDWYINLIEEMLDVWDDLVLSNSPVLDRYDVPKSPSYLIPDDLKEPGFITMAIALDGLGRTTNLSKKTSATNPYDAIKQAYGQELVAQANVLINYVKNGGGPDKVRDVALYTEGSPFSETGMDDDEKEAVQKRYNEEAWKFNQTHGRVYRDGKYVEKDEV